LFSLCARLNWQLACQFSVQVIYRIVSSTDTPHPPVTFRDTLWIKEKPHYETQSSTRRPLPAVVQQTSAWRSQYCARTTLSFSVYRSRVPLHSWAA